MNGTYSEIHLVELPAMELLKDLGWETKSAQDEAFGESGTLGREMSGEVVLLGRVRAAVENLNPGLSPEGIAGAIEELTRGRAAMEPSAANREVYELLKEGVPVSVPDRVRGGQKIERVRVINWEDPASNDFLAVRQMTFTGSLYTCRPDVVGFVNGLPLVVVEFKKPGVAARLAFEDNLTSYKHAQNGVPALFWYNALLIASNGMESRVGSLTANWERFFEWKRVEREDEPRHVSLEVMLRGICDKKRLLDLIENFTLFSAHKTGLVKILAQNHQFLGVNAAYSKLLQICAQREAASLTPTPLPLGEGHFRREEGAHYRGGLSFSGLMKRARELRQQQTPAEEIAWELLRDRRFCGLKFRRQHQIGNYIADFCCPECYLIIELDGEIHKTPEAQSKDSTRDAALRSLGFKILRFRNEFVLRKTEDFLQALTQTISVPPPSTPGRGVEGEGNTPNSNGIGVFWQTQGSGKSLSMVFYAQKILRKVPGNWTFVVITDRVELDDQIAKTFAACGAVTDANACHATSGAHLRQLLGENHRYVFTLIHKFQTPEVLCDRPDVIVLTDEAHRSQYDTLALNMRSALPNALFLAFTGTPLIVGEERTREVFGDYVSIYDFQQSVEDHATVPLFYENRTPELQLTNPALNEDIYEVIEDVGLDEAQEERLLKVLGKQYHVLTRDDRLETVAKDIVWHFLGRGFQGKAMVVSIDKATALRMCDKVQKYWAIERAAVENELAKSAKIKKRTPELLSRVQELNRRMDVLKRTDMALIVSPGQNEVEQMKAFGLDIVPHRKRMNESQPSLDEKFKDPADPLSLVFVCAMWLTGFDAPNCSTIYLDKPMRNHTLMQTIARANRVFPGKHSGVIVDYANVFASLEKALAIYGAGKGGTTPVRNKKKLVEELENAVNEATTFCEKHGVILSAIEQLSRGDMQLLKRLGDAVNALISPDPLRKDFLGHERIVRTLNDAVKPDPAGLKFALRVNCLKEIANLIRARIQPGQVDVSAAMTRINEVLDRSINGVAIPSTPAAVMDLSKIDFAALAKRFKASKRKNLELEALKTAVKTMLNRLIRLNRTRIDFQEKFEELIEAYNSGSKNIEELFNELINLSRSLTDEQTRHVREKLTEEELTIFDILTRPSLELSPEERDEVKKVARELLERVKELLVLNWRQKSSTRSQIKLTIEDVLDTGLPRIYDKGLYEKKCSSVFKHVYESYPERDQGVYAEAG